MIPLILGIFSGKDIKINDFTAGTDVEPNEKVVGEIVDDHLRSLRKLSIQLHDTAKKQMPPDLPLPVEGVLDQVKALEWLLNQTIGGITEVMERANRTVQLSQIVQDLFWCGVSDTMPEVCVGQVSLRAGWKLVQEEEPEILKDLSRFGGMIIEIHDDSGLEDFLSQLSRS